MLPDAWRDLKLEKQPPPKLKLKSRFFPSLVVREGLGVSYFQAITPLIPLTSRGKWELK
jgi:hypothetical protein